MEREVDQRLEDGIVRGRGREPNQQYMTLRIAVNSHRGSRGTGKNQGMLIKSVLTGGLKYIESMSY